MENIIFDFFGQKSRSLLVAGANKIIQNVLKICFHESLLTIQASDM
jgi:hypothetical protein